LFSVVLVGGLGFVVTQYARLGKERPPPEPTIQLTDQPLPPSDAGEEFQGLRDREPILFADTAAYATLLRRARESSPAKDGRQRSQDILFRQLIERPARYRGLPVHVVGAAIQVARLDDIPTELSPQGHLYEAWVVNRDSLGYPYCLVFEELPAGLVLGSGGRQEVRFDGYFLKLMAYEGGKSTGGAVRRYAPMLVGRVLLVDLSSGQRPTERAKQETPPWLLGGLILGLVYVAIRWLLWIRKQNRPASVPVRRTIATDRISEDELATWLREPEPKPVPESESHESHARNE
jgi:hypothetical protein